MSTSAIYYYYLVINIADAFIQSNLKCHFLSGIQLSYYVIADLPEEKAQSKPRLVSSSVPYCTQENGFARVDAAFRRGFQ